MINKGFECGTVTFLQQVQKKSFFVQKSSCNVQNYNIYYHLIV